MRKLLTLVAALLLSVTLFAGVPDRPDPIRFVNDYASVFSNADCERLEERLAAYSDTTSTQIVVVAVPDLEGQDASSYATEIGESWKVGSADFDNGVVVLVKPKNENGSGEVFIAVGYGLEGAIPDAYAKRIINEIMIPKFIEGDYFAAVDGACDRIIRLAEGEEFVSSGADGDADDESYIWWSLMLIGLVLAYFFKKPKNGGKNGGGSSGGSSRGVSHRTVVPPIGRIFSGGGGSSSGRSFGGGSFGGGGAGGKW